MKDQLDKIEAKIDKLDELLRGKDGVLMQVDRNTRWISVRRWLEKTVIGAIVLLVFNEIFG